MVEMLGILSFIRRLPRGGPKHLRRLVLLLFQCIPFLPTIRLFSDVWRFLRLNLEHRRRRVLCSYFLRAPREFSIWGSYWLLP